jgi:hypothetical protein
MSVRMRRPSPSLPNQALQLHDHLSGDLRDPPRIAKSWITARSSGRRLRATAERLIVSHAD